MDVDKSLSMKGPAAAKMFNEGKLKSQSMRGTEFSGKKSASSRSKSQPVPTPETAGQSMPIISTEVGHGNSQFGAKYGDRDPRSGIKNADRKKKVGKQDVARDQGVGEKDDCDLGPVLNDALYNKGAGTRADVRPGNDDANLKPGTKDSFRNLRAAKQDDVRDQGAGKRVVVRDQGAGKRVDARDQGAGKKVKARDPRPVLEEHYYSSGAGTRADARPGMRGVRDFGDGTMASYRTPTTPDGVISARDLLSKMPFEINIQTPASKELVGTKGTELTSRGSSIKTVSDLLKEDMRRRDPNCSTDEVVRNFGDPLAPKCLCVVQEAATMENL